MGGVDLRVQGVGENLESVDEAGAGPAEPGVAIHQIEFAAAGAGPVGKAGGGAERRQFLPAAGEIKSTAGDHQHFGVGLGDLGPIEAAGGLCGNTRHAVPPGPLDELGSPVADVEGGIDPFEDEGAGAMIDRGRACADRLAAGLPTGHQPLGIWESVGCLAEVEEGREQFVEGLRVNGEKLGGTGEFPEDLLQIAGPYGTDITQRLGDNEVGCKGLEAGEIEGEGGAAGQRLIADRLVDLQAGEVGVEEGAGDPGEVLDGGGKIAFMTDRHQLFFETEQAEQLGDAGHEGDDASRGAGRCHGGDSLCGSRGRLGRADGGLAVGVVRWAGDAGRVGAEQGNEVRGNVGRGQIWKFKSGCDNDLEKAILTTRLGPVESLSAVSAVDCNAAG